LPKRKTGEDSAKRLRVLRKHLGSAKSSTKVAPPTWVISNDQMVDTEIIDDSLKHLMLTYFPSFREDSINPSS